MLQSFGFKLGVYFVVIALVPVATAFYGFDLLSKRDETRRVDAEIQAALQSSASAYSAQIRANQLRAKKLARSSALQQALLAGDRVTLSRIVASNPHVTIAGNGVRLGAAPVSGISRSVSVIAGGHVIGRVSAVLPIDDVLLRRIRTDLDRRDELVAVRDGRIVAGPHRGELLALVPGRPSRVSLGGADYRGLATSSLVTPGALGLVTLAPQRRLDAAIAAARRRIALGVVLTTVLLGILTYVLGRSIVRSLGRLSTAANAMARGGGRELVEGATQDELARATDGFNRLAVHHPEQGRIQAEDERGHAREAALRSSNALAARHDVELLLRMTVETAIDATGAAGGIVFTENGELARVGDPHVGTARLELPVLVGGEPFARIVLSGYRFNDDQLWVARSLVSRAVVALENA